MLTTVLRLLMTRSFKPFVFSSTSGSELDINVKSLGLYFHIPFCKKICDFCPYYKVKYDRGLLNEFIISLFRELELVAGLSASKQRVTSIYFGGGSPALMIDRLPELMERIKELFAFRGHAGIELHPRDVDQKTLRKIRLAGIDMVSIGIQSFQDKCLKSLGRREKIDGARKLVMAADSGFRVIDVDLIFGIHGQTAGDMVKDFRIAAHAGATQISTYPFIEFSYTEPKEKPQGRRVQREMLESLKNISDELGFERSSIWTYGRKASSRYSSVTRDNYIGFGPSAATLLRDVFKINTFSVDEYIKCLRGNKIPTALYLKFNERRRALYWLFWSVYNMDVSERDFYELFGKELKSIFKFELSLGTKLNYFKKYENGYRVTDRGAYLFHLVEQAYTHQYIDKTWATAMGDPWPQRLVLY